MNDMKALLLVSQVLVLGSCLALIGIGALRARIPEALRAKYPKAVLSRSQLPFTENWRASIDSKDLPILLKARTRKFVFTLVLGSFLYLLLALKLLAAHILIQMLAS